MQTIKYGKIAGLAVIFMMQAAVAATFTVSQDGRGQFKSIQEAINAAGMGDEVVILDAAVYKEQVTIDSLHQGLTLRSENPIAANKPTIQYQDRTNVGPTTAAEALNDSTITFDYNGALRLIATASVRIEGLAIDGGGVYPFGYDGIWESRYALQHGNAALVITISGETVIRDCDISNAYFGIFFKDRNEGGVFCNPNPADLDPENIIPFSAFARTGNHLLEYSRIHDNSVGMFFESSWDMGSTIRYNLIYENHHPTAAIATKVKGLTGSEGNNQAGGAFMFKDHLLSPLAIYNNTLWHNSVIFLGNWKSGGQHLIFNNIFAQPNEYWNNSTTTFSTSFDMSKIFVNRMHNCVYAAQQQAPTASYTAITNDLRPAQTGGSYDEGALITPFPSGADVRWVETSFLSVNPTAANFLEPDWNDAEVKSYIVDKGWTEAGVKDPDGSRADLGAIPMGGGRPVDVITIRPTIPVEITGTTAKIGFNVTPRIGTMTDLKIVYFGIVTRLDTSDVFGSSYTPITAANIQKLTVPSQKIELGTNIMEVTVPATGDFAFIEMVVEGIGSDGQPFTTAVGFIPYRKLEYILDVVVRDRVGGTAVTTVRAGQQVVLEVKARRGTNPFTNKIDPTDVKLQSRFPLLDPSGTPVTNIPGGIQGTANVDVVFTRVPLGGVEYVLVAGRWIDQNKVIAFLGSSQGVRVLAGPADSISFQRPASGMTEIINQGETFAVRVQAFDMYGNKVDSAYEVKCVSTKPDIGIIADSLNNTDSTGLATFRAMVTNGDSGMVFPLVATLVIKPTETDTAYLMVGQKLPKLWVYYGDTLQYDPTAEIRGCAGIRVPVTIRASKDGATIATDKNTSFTISFLGGLAAYATETSAERITSSQLVAGQVKIWIQATSKNVTDGQITVTSNEPNVLSGERRDINFDACFTLITKATYFANNGRGSVDVVEIYYDSALAPTDIPDSILLYWPGLTGVNSQSRIVRRQNIVQDAADPAHLTVTIPEPFPEGITRHTESSANLGKTYWWNPSTPDAPTVEFNFNIEDGVGPLLSSALLIERLTAGFDTMIIDFTEPVEFQKVTGLSLTLIKGTRQIPLEVIHSQPETNVQGAPTGRTIVVIADLSAADAPKEGDSLKITPEGPVADAVGNHAHPLNRPVVLSSRKIAPDILSAVYSDRDGNGMVDHVRISFNKVVEPEFMGMSFSWQGSSGNAKTEQFAFVGTGGDTVDVYIAELFPASVLQDKTSGVMNVTVFFSNYETNNTKFKPVDDGAAPVVTEVRYHFGAYLDNDTGTAPDTVYATFSEPLKSPPAVNQPLLFMDALGNPYAVTVLETSTQLDVNKCRFVVTRLDPAGTRPANNDSAWINADPAIADVNVIDMVGNVQRVVTNKKVPITVKRSPFKLKVLVGPNPFNPNGGETVSILIKAKAKVAEETTYKTNLVIYDKVGNVVYQPPEMVAVDSCQLEWAGTNKQNRIVGNGTYLAYVKVLYTTKGETTAWNEIIKLGVRRE